MSSLKFILEKGHNCKKQKTNNVMVAYLEKESIRKKCEHKSMQALEALDSLLCFCNSRIQNHCHKEQKGK